MHDDVRLVEWTGTEHMVADALTKALSQNKCDSFKKV
jgi:hypothetical protein